MGILQMLGLSALSIHNGRNQVAQPLAVDLGFKAHGHALLLQGIDKAFGAVDFVALLGRDLRLAFMALGLHGPSTVIREWLVSVVTT